MNGNGSGDRPAALFTVIAIAICLLAGGLLLGLSVIVMVALLAITALVTVGVFFLS